jgi:dihydrofolate reductase
MNISVYLASSVNGMISNKANVPDWLSPEYERGFLAICQRMKAVVMGKTTYGILSPDYLPLKGEGTLIVLTHDTAAKPPQSNVVFTDKTPLEIVRILEARGHHEAVIIGGTQTVSGFVKSGLVDELYLVVEPVLFGTGLPLLRNVDAEYKMTLLDVQKLNPHTVQLHYRLMQSLNN